MVRERTKGAFEPKVPFKTENWSDSRNKSY